MIVPEPVAPRDDIEFDVEASVATQGTFDKWGASLTFASANVETAAFDVKIHADTADSGQH